MEIRESFVIHTEYIEDLPTEEYKMQFLQYIYNYGAKGIVPELTGLELTIWLKIQRRIDADIEAWELAKVQRSNAGKKHKGNQYTRKNGTEWNEMEHRSICSNETERNGTSWNELERNGTNGTVSVSVYDNVSVSEYESVSSEATSCDVENSLTLSDSLQPNNSEYSKQVFEVFKDAGLPCASGNELSFLQRDFKNGMKYLHSNYEGLHSDEVIQACKNYALVSKTRGTWFTNKYGFESFCKIKNFRDFLPSNFVIGNFMQNGTDPPPIEKPKKDLPKIPAKCPSCGKKISELNRLDSGMIYCKNCHQEFEFITGQWLIPSA